MKQTRSTRGYTTPEIVIALVIIAILAAMGLSAFIGARKSSELSTQADQIVFRLEQARASALAGRYGVGAGVDFSSTTATFFVGNSYDPSTSTDATFIVTNGYTVTTTPVLGDLIFTRLTGVPQTMATVTISDTSNPGRNKSITIGAQGEISVVK